MGAPLGVRMGGNGGRRQYILVKVRPMGEGIRVVPCAKPVVLEDEPLARAQETVGSNEGELVMVHLDVHITPCIRREER